MTLKAGVKRDGTLTALEFTCLATGGAYPAGGTSLVDWLIRDLYACPNVRTTCTDVFINAGPARAFRAPGHPQGAWALEQMMDALAEAIGMDPVQLRLKNIPTFSQAREGNPAYTTTGFKECLEQGAAAFGWEKARRETGPKAGQGHMRRGVGMAGCLWFAGGGRPPSTVIVKLFSDGSVNLNMGASDLGTGTKTVMAMVVAEELGDQARSHPDRERRYRHHPVRNAQRRQQDGADGGAGGAKRCRAGQAEAAGDGGRGAEDGSVGAGLPGARDRLPPGCVQAHRGEGSRCAEAARGCGRRRLSRPQSEEQGRQSLRGAVLRGRGEHEDRRGEDPAVRWRPTTAAG